MKRIILLGATGSIGQQTIDVIRLYPHEFELVGIAGGYQTEALYNLVKEFPSIQAVASQVSLPPLPCQQWVGDQAMCELLKACDYDLLVNATVGFRGLAPTLLALEQGKPIALANKESMVCGGPLIERFFNHQIYPIDSEHSAIDQCLQGLKSEEVERLYITASGGSLRHLSRDQLANISVQQALAHPNWSMGARITIDSATMVNKAFEVIEAHYLFGIDYDHITALLHPQSAIHSMVQTRDGALLAQAGTADMHLPIAYALNARQRLLLPYAHYDFSQLVHWQFSPMDLDRFPLFDKGVQAGKKKGNMGCILNGADEQAIAYFLEEKITYLELEQVIIQALEQAEFIAEPSYEQLVESDGWARQFVDDFVTMKQQGV